MAATTKAGTRWVRLLKLAVIGGLWIALAVHVEGCSLIGLAVGTAADAQVGTGGPGMLFGVKTGRHVSLTLWDGRTLEGHFAGWVRDSGAAIAAGDTLSPRGRTVRLLTEKGEVAVHVEDIAKVLVTVNGGKVYGLVVGLALDALVISAIHAADHPHVADDCGGPSPSWGAMSMRTSAARQPSRRPTP